VAAVPPLTGKLKSGVKADPRGLRVSKTKQRLLLDNNSTDEEENELR